MLLTSTINVKFHEDSDGLRQAYGIDHRLRNMDVKI